jgi:hypothetical protein
VNQAVNLRIVLSRAEVKQLFDKPLVLFAPVVGAAQAVKFEKA